MSWIENLRSVDWDQASGLMLFSYLLGCFTAGYYLVRMLADKDIREIGSGSVGSKNVGRVLGKTGFCLTAFSDIGKGALAVWIARHFTTAEIPIALVMLAVVAGHIWPAQLRLQGGKGMATSLGALLIYDLQLFLTFGVMFLCLFALLRRTILPGLFSLLCVPLAAVLLGHTQEKITLLFALAGMVLLAHRKNVVDEIFLLARRHLQPKPDQSQL